MAQPPLLCEPLRGGEYVRVSESPAVSVRLKSPDKEFRNSSGRAGRGSTIIAQISMKTLSSMLIAVLAMHSQCAASCLDAYLHPVQKPACHHDAAPPSGQNTSDHDADSCGRSGSAISSKVSPCLKFNLEWAALEFIEPSTVPQEFSPPASVVSEAPPHYSPPGSQASILRI